MSREPVHFPVPPAERARADWQAGKARVLVVGLLRRGPSPINAETGLYVGSLGCVLDDAVQAYGKEYNAQIQALLKEFGRPAWAPANRLPERQRLLELMSEAQPVTTQEALEALKLGSLGYGFPGPDLQESDLVPAVAYRRMEDPGLLLLGSDANAMSGRIDVFDLRDRMWVASEVFDRRQVGRMPWDKWPHDVKDAVRDRHAAKLAALAAERERLRVERDERARLAEANRQRCPVLVEAMKERDFTCPHCQSKTRFRYLQKSECFVCLKCSRSSTALMLEKHPLNVP